MQDLDLMPGATPDLPRSPYNRPDLVRDARDAEADAAPIDWQGTIRRRLVVLAGLLLLWAIGIQARLVVLQVAQHDRWAAQLIEQVTHQVEVPGPRGTIVDRNGVTLAASVESATIVVNALAVKAGDRDRVARELCGLIDRCTPADYDQLIAGLARKSRGTTVWRNASPADAERIDGMKSNVVWSEPEPRRYYPNRELAAHVVGFVGDGNRGLEGVERSYDEYLRGKPGWRLSYEDAHRQAFDSEEATPVPGKTLELTLDGRLQHDSERALSSRIGETGSSSGLVIVSVPQTGEILALALWPTYNPNTFARTEAALLKNRAVQDVYEPGSTMKFITAATAIDLGLFTPQSLFNLGNGQMRLGNHVIRDTHAYGTLSLRDVVAKSSNVGAVQIGHRIGAERFSEYVAKFGLGQANLRDFRGQSRGIVTPLDKLTSVSLGSMSYGYSIGVTAMQMVAAINTIANGGTLVEPHVVRAVIDGAQRKAVAPRAIRRVISEQTAATMTTILESVVEDGTGKAAALAGYTVAGKTGTARRVKQGGRGYSDQHTSSFVGYVPSRNPAISILVVIDAPKSGGYYGGTIAAPVFKAVAESALRYYGVAPTIESEERSRIVVARSAPATAPGPAVVAAPNAPARQPDLTTVAITPGKMPDLRGLSAREAVRVATRLGLVVRVAGDGMVAGQDLEAGTDIESGTVCRLTLERRPRAVAQGIEP